MKYYKISHPELRDFVKYCSEKSFNSYLDARLKIKGVELLPEESRGGFTLPIPYEDDGRWKVPSKGQPFVDWGKDYGKVPDRTGDFHSHPSESVGVPTPSIKEALRVHYEGVFTTPLFIKDVEAFLSDLKKGRVKYVKARHAELKEEVRNLEKEIRVSAPVTMSEDERLLKILEGFFPYNLPFTCNDIVTVCGKDAHFLALCKDAEMSKSCVAGSVLGKKLARLVKDHKKRITRVRGRKDGARYMLVEGGAQ